MLRYHIIVNGDVQRVGFRYFTQRYAAAIGICGWVRNRSDGTVEIEAEGNDKEMKDFISVLRKGSRYSNVETLDVQTMKDLKNYSSFNITGDSC